MNALTVPATPAQLAAAGNPIGDSLWVETVVAETFAPTWQALEAQVAPVCWCDARRSERCRTRSGRVTRDHSGRVA